MLDFQYFSKKPILHTLCKCLSFNKITIFSVFHNITLVILVTYWFSVDLQVLSYHRNFASSSLWYWLLKRSRSRSRYYGSVPVPVIRLSGSRSLYRKKFFDKYDRRAARRLFCDGTTLWRHICKQLQYPLWFSNGTEVIVVRRGNDSKLRQ